MVKKWLRRILFWIALTIVVKRLCLILFSTEISSIGLAFVIAVLFFWFKIDDETSALVAPAPRSQPERLDQFPERQIATAIQIGGTVYVRDAAGAQLFTLSCAPGEAVVSVAGGTVSIGKAGHGRTYDGKGVLRGRF